jgi:hypothetical protein
MGTYLGNWNKFKKGGENNNQQMKEQHRRALLCRPLLTISENDHFGSFLSSLAGPAKKRISDGHNE